MNRTTTLLRASALAAIIALAGCGEGGGSAPQTASGAPAPTAAIPAPTPAPKFDTLPFALGQPGGYAFAVLGYKVASQAGPWENIPDPATFDTSVPIGFSHSGSGNFRLSIGGLGEGPVLPNGGGGITNPGNRTVQFGFNALGGSGSISEANDFAARPLTSTAQGYLSVTARPNQVLFADDYAFVYGVPTPASAVPTSGNAEYRTCCDGSFIGLRIDFADGILRVSSPVEGLVFTDVRLGADRSTFAGQFTSPDGSGTVEGRMTGPDGREMMMRLHVPGKSVQLVALRRFE